MTPRNITWGRTATAEPAPEPAGGVALTSVMLLLLLIWIIGTLTCLLAAVASGPFLAQDIEAARLNAMEHAQKNWLAAAVGFGSIPPLLGVALAVGSRRVMTAWAWALGLGVVLVFFVLLAMVAVPRGAIRGPAPTWTPTPEASHCVVYSGGTNTCPGG